MVQYDLLLEETLNAIQKTQRFFLDRQQADGHWVAELEGDALLESEMILLLAFLRDENSELAKNCARHLIKTQVSDGGWEMFPGAGADVTNSVKAYFALKLTGYDPSSEEMQRARRKILSLGGADQVNSFTRFYLALLGQIPYEKTPAVPPQMILFPKWFPVNIYAMSSWSRTIFVPLSIVSALQPIRPIPIERGIRELFVSDPRHWKPLVCPGKKKSTTLFSWGRFFRLVDKMIWKCRKWQITPARRHSIELAKKWMLLHFERSDGPGAINPPIIWSLVALKALGYSDESPEIRECRQQLNALVINNPTDKTARVQPCKSPVWDTLLTLKALLLSGLSRNNSAIQNGLNWVLNRQIKVPGDWSQTLPKVRPGGWAFEYRNDFYPDNDDTAMALIVLGGAFQDALSPFLPEGTFHSKMSDKTSAFFPLFSSQSVDVADISESDDFSEVSKRRQEAVLSGLNWLLSMQNDDGGWAAFDRNNSLEFLCEVPFADHNAMIDPSSPDLTGRVMEALGRLGVRLVRQRTDSNDKQSELDDLHQVVKSEFSERGERAVRRVVDYMRQKQLPDGSWFGRWGINYIYGTWQALTGLNAVGVSQEDEMIRAGAHWLLVHQQPCGGWGESPDSYRDSKLRGQGPPTASQTAWALMGLLASGLGDHPSVKRGIQYLIKSQNVDGSWSETAFTGTGFPQVFYLKYHFYPNYFPLMALSLFAKHCEDFMR